VHTGTGVAGLWFRGAGRLRGRVTGLWMLWRAGGERGEGLAAPFEGAGREAGGGAAGVVVLAGVVGGEDALVADGEQAGEPEGNRGQAGEAALSCVNDLGQFLGLLIMQRLLRPGIR
jgi:hypothetical protein